jgi:6-phosphogluconate dehydrogenase
MNNGQHTTDIQIGLIGLGVMGQNLALNLLDHKAQLAVYSYDSAEREEFIAGLGNMSFLVAADLSEFTRVLPQPRIILLMVTAGEAVDRIIADLLPLLSAGDIIIDGGNSHYKDTMRREESLVAQQIHFVGTGISGGEEGARNGASIMVGGDASAFTIAEPVFAALSTNVKGEGCYAHLGSNGAGHFVKMVHNGIEYGVMQLIAEAYQFMGRALSLSNTEMQSVFADWQQGPLHSYLIDITGVILGTLDPDNNNPMIDFISDRAGQKGTGRWTVDAAMELGVPAPTIIAAVTERQISSLVDLRSIASSSLPTATPASPLDPADWIERIEQALLAGMIATYAQGLNIIQVASKANDWATDLTKVVKLWRGGCIIRAALLDDLVTALAEPAANENLLLSRDLGTRMSSLLPACRDIVTESINHRISMPGMSSILTYHTSLHTERLPTNMIQAQRDYFGAHTYERVDKPGVFHTAWPQTSEWEP